MAKRHTPEEIVTKLRQVDVLVSQGSSVADAIRGIAVTEVTYHRWRQEYGGLKLDQIKRMRDLETENSRLRNATAVSAASGAGMRKAWTGGIPFRFMGVAATPIVALGPGWVGTGPQPVEGCGGHGIERGAASPSH